MGATQVDSRPAERRAPAAGGTDRVLRIAVGALTPVSVAGRIDGVIGRAARLGAVREQLSALHQRILEGDREAAGEVWTIAAPELRRRLRGRTKPYQWARLEDAITDACAKLGRVPDRFDPARGDLLSWLTRVVRNRLFDLLRESERRRRHEAPLLAEAVHRLPDLRGEDARVRAQSVADHLHELRSVATNETERRFLEAHVRAAPLAEVAAILKTEHLNVAAQEAIK